MKRAALFTLACTVLTLGSCITFERQTMVFRYDPAEDRLLIFQLYEGIHGEDSGESLNGKENAEILSVLEGQRTFFFSNWILEYDRAAIEDLAGAPATNESEEHRRELAKLLLANATVKNGRFFLNEEGKLSGYQFASLDNASKVVTQANRSISAAIPKGLQEKKDPSRISEESRRRILAAAEAGHEWIRLDTNTIHLRYPMTYGDFKEVRRELADSLLEALKTAKSPEPKLAGMVEQLSSVLQSDLSIAYLDGMVDIRLGDPGCSEAELAMNASESEYKPNVVRFAEKHGGLEGSPDLRGLMAEFFRSKQSVGRPGRGPDR